MRLRRRLALALIIPLFVVTAAFQGRQSPPKPQPKPEEQIVYVTKTGEKYHAGTCRHLSRSKIPITLGEAVKRFGPCSVCKPPVLPKK